MMQPIYLGLDVGGTKCSVLIGDGAGNIVGEPRRWLTRSERGPESIIADLLRDARALINQQGAPLAIGVSIGGPLNAREGIVLSPPNLPGWDSIPLAERLRHELRLPVQVMHDAAACAMAEYLWGAASGCQRVAYLTCATGFGVGFVFDGQVYHGGGGINAEIGHVQIREDGPEAFGKRGCAEAYGSARSLSRLAAWRFPARWGDHPPTPREISDLWQAGDTDARQVIELNAHAVGDVAAMLGDTLQLDCILLGSLAQYLGDPWLTMVRDRFDRQVLPRLRQTCPIRPCALADRLQDLSSLAAARSGPASP